ncbi:MAG: hypothetical protein ACLFPO_00915 [Spirochaetaceae bacterium]
MAARRLDRPDGVRARIAGTPRILLVLLLAAGMYTVVAPPPAHGQSGNWAAVAEASGPEQDALIAELLATLPLTDALAIARSLPRREHADIGGALRALHRGPARGARRAELLTRVALDALQALPDARRRTALDANAETLRRFLAESPRLDSPMLRASVWRAVAGSDADLRRAVLPQARTAAAALHARFVAEADSRARDVGPGGEEHPELVAEALAFFSYADATPDATLRTLVDAIRRESRDTVLVERAREVIESPAAEPDG